MNYLSYLIFLATLASFQLLLWFALKVLETLQVAPRQKMFIFRTGLVLLLVTPVIFTVFKVLSVNTINIPIAPMNFDPHTAKGSEFLVQPKAFSWAHWIFIIYVIGASLSLLKLSWDYIATWRWLRNSKSSELLNSQVSLSDKIQSPLSFGILSPQIYFPTNAKQVWNEREIQLGLQHERTHLEHRDPFWKVVSMIGRSILFFAPWAYALHRKLELEMEIYCDEVTRSKTGASLEEYGTLLLAMIAPQSSITLLTTNMTDSTIKRRVVAMKSRKIQRPIVTTVFSAVLFLFGSAAIATSSGVGQKKSMYDFRGTIFLDGQKISSPRLVFPEGEIPTIIQQGDDGNVLKMEFTAGDVSIPQVPNGIAISAELLYQHGHESKEAREKFQLIVGPKKEGTISFDGQDGHTYEMRFVIDRIIQ